MYVIAYIEAIFVDTYILLFSNWVLVCYQCFIQNCSFGKYWVNIQFSFTRFGLDFIVETARCIRSIICFDKMQQYAFWVYIYKSGEVSMMSINLKLQCIDINMYIPNCFNSCATRKFCTFNFIVIKFNLYQLQGFVSIFYCHIVYCHIQSSIGNFCMHTRRIYFTCETVTKT